MKGSISKTLLLFFENMVGNLKSITVINRLIPLNINVSRDELSFTDYVRAY